MPNWKKVIVSGSDAILNSVTASFTGSLTGALIGTASWANNATTATQVLTQTDSTNASYFLTAVNSNNGTPTAENLLTATGVLVNPAARSLQVQGAMTASTGFLGPIFTTKATTGVNGGLHRLALVTASGADESNREIRWATDLYVNPTFGILYAASVTASGGFTGSLAGSASYALNGGVTSIVAGTNVTISPTNGLGAVTINATGGGPGSSDFPYTGSAIISGSLLVTGSVQAGLGGFTGSSLGTASFSTNTFTNLKKTRLEMGISSEQTITTGAKGRKTVSFDGTIVGWRLVADQATFTNLDIWKANSAIPTSTNSITAGNYPFLNTNQLQSSTTLTGWTTSVSAGDVFILEVVSNDAAKYLFLELDIVLTNA